MAPLPGPTAGSGSPAATWGGPASAEMSAPSLFAALARWAVVIELFLLALFVVAPLGGVTLSLSPLTQVWPWLLAPARAVFGSALVGASVTPERGWPQLALFATLLVGASAAAGMAVWRALPALPARPAGQRDERRGLWLALGVTALLGVTLALLPALPSDDVFSYILYGRISALGHANPLIATPADFPHDPFLSLVYWQNTRSVYGPVWLALSAGLTQIAQALGGGLATYVALFKALGLAAHLANTALVWLILGRLAPQRRLAGTLFYGWNPLCLLEFCASAHNDAVMLFFLLLGMYALVRGREALGLIALGLSIATKITPVALLPLLLAYDARALHRRGLGWRRVGLALAWRLAVVGLTVALVTAPYWAGPRTLGALLFSPPAQQLDNSLLEAVSWPLRWLAQGTLGLSATQASGAVNATLKALALAAYALLWLGEFRRTRSLPGVFSAWGWALLWYALVASGWFWPWYGAWVVVVAAVAPWGRLQPATLLLAAGALTLYGFLPLQAASVYGFRSVVVFGPALVYLLVCVRRDRRAWSSALRGAWEAALGWGAGVGRPEPSAPGEAAHGQGE